MVCLINNNPQYMRTNVTNSYPRLDCISLNGMKLKENRRITVKNWCLPFCVVEINIALFMILCIDYIVLVIHFLNP